MEAESLKKIKHATEKCIMELGKKSDLNPSEVKSALDGFELIAWINGELEKSEIGERGYSQYSGCGEPYATPRRYNITSYGQPGMPMSYRDNAYGMNGPMNSGFYSGERGYSRHSIGDRAISCLEQMMGEASSDYERQQLHRFMEMIRSAE